jgi:radical SAM superfamily enzyme YgiQ (UPF0313 family)
MKIALIIPRNSSEDEQNFYDLKFISRFLYSKKYFAYLLAVPTLVSLTPREHEVRVFDENIEDIDYGWDPDLVGISVRTMFANRAYRISDNFRERGVKTVLGGIHPTMCTDEALQHCDTVVIGEADNVWQTLLRDAENGGLKSTYKYETPTDLTTSPAPAWSVLLRDRYISDIVQTTKGCPFHCEFCSVYAFDGQRIRNKTVQQVIKEIEGLGGSIANFKKKAIFFADDNIIANKKFARELFLALKELNIKWSCQASINIAKDDEILGLMKECGCGAMLIGLESISEKNLSLMNKGVNLKNDYVSAIKKIQSYGILVNGSFILGYDFDTQSSFDELIDFIEEARLLMPLINILTPYPGTRLFQRLEEEGRILHRDWSKYDSKHVVFSPSLLTPEELLEGHKKVIRRIYSFDSIYRRLQYYWDIDFWRPFNEEDPLKFKYRLLFALRLITLLFSSNLERSKFILKILPKVFGRRIRISTVLNLMAYNDYAYSA